MPVRSLTTSVLAWPKKSRVESALKSWAQVNAASTPELIAVGYIGSYARGDWGVGSDVDLVLVLGKSNLPYERRALGFDVTQLPVPADLLVYTREELRALMARGGRFAQTLRSEATWVWRHAGFAGLPG